jgi:hypothetical protein
MSTRKIVSVMALAIAAVTAGLAYAQNAWQQRDDIPPNPKYDGRFTFARLRYPEHLDDPCTCLVRSSTGPAGWQHDYPNGERNIMRIMTDITTLHAHVDSSAIVTADDPALMRYPILYLSEPACWKPSETDVKALRRYLLKGGFLIVDDFSMCTGGPVRFAMSKRMFEEQIHRVLPEGKLVPVPFDDPALNSFFKLDPQELQRELQRTAGADHPPEVYGIYEHNDPHRRLMVAANYNTVIHTSWVWQSQGLSSVADNNEAYKLGVNYLMYGLTH